MKNFKQVVTMKVTEEQFNNDLKKPLRELGYNFNSLPSSEEMKSDFKNGYNILSNSYGNSNNKEWLGDLGLYDIKALTHIENYNPELYLALAAMTEGSTPIKGEYVISTSNSSQTKIPKGCIVKVISEFSSNNAAYATDYNNNYNNSSTFYSRKATKEELINHFKLETIEEFMLPKSWCIKITEENRELVKEWYGDSTLQVNYGSYYGINTKFYKDGRSSMFMFDKEITFKQFKKYVLKIKDMKTDNRFPFKLTLEQVKTIHNDIIEGGCQWEEFVQTRLMPQFLTKNYAILETRDYKNARKEANSEQNLKLDKIFGKDVVELQYPININEIPHRDYYVKSGMMSKHSTVKGIRALIQLVELRDAWNKIDGFEVDFTDDRNYKYVIFRNKNELEISFYKNMNYILAFGSPKTRDKFLVTFKDLIEEAKEFI